MNQFHSLLFDKDFGLIKDATHPAFIATERPRTMMMPLPPPSAGLDPTQHLPGPSIAIDSQEQAWQRLITRAVPHHELPSLIETVFSGRETDVADRLKRSDAQAFIDIIDEVYRLLFIPEEWLI